MRAVPRCNGEEFRDCICHTSKPACRRTARILDRLHERVRPVLARSHFAPAATALGRRVTKTLARIARVDRRYAIHKRNRMPGLIEHQLGPLHGTQHLGGAVGVRDIRWIRLDRRDGPGALDVAREEVARD